MKNTPVFRIMALAAGLSVLAGASHADPSVCDAMPANLLSNCGFETTDFSGWTLSGVDVSGGALGNLYGVETGADPLDNISPHSGNAQAFFADSTANAIQLSQSVAILAGSTYKVSFYLAQDTAPEPSQPGSDNSLSVSLGGALAKSLTRVPMQGYALVSFNAVAGNTDKLLSLTLGNDIGQFLLDDLSLSFISSPVPEPASLALLSLGLLALGLRRWRRT